MLDVVIAPVQRARPGALEGIAVLRVDLAHEGLKRHALCYVHIENPIGFLRPIKLSAGNVKHPAPDVRYGLRTIEHRLALSQRILLRTALSDVEGDPENPDQAAAGVENRCLGRAQQHTPAIFGIGDPFLVDGGLSLRNGKLVVATEEVGKFPCHEGVVAATEDRLFRMTEEALEFAVAGKIDPVRILQPDKLRNAANERLQQQPLTVPGLKGCPLPTASHRVRDGAAKCDNTGNQHREHTEHDCALPAPLGIDGGDRRTHEDGEPVTIAAPVGIQAADPVGDTVAADVDP